MSSEECESNNTNFEARSVVEETRRETAELSTFEGRKERIPKKEIQEGFSCSSQSHCWIGRRYKD